MGSFCVVVPLSALVLNLNRGANILNNMTSLRISTNHDHHDTRTERTRTIFGAIILET